MGLREWFNKHPNVAYGAVSVVILLAIGMIVQQVLASRHVYPPAMPDDYFSVDDGKTFFSASSTNHAPFSYEGKTAVKANVFKSSTGKTFVGFLERYTTESKSQLDNGKALSPQIMRFGREIKRPGDTEWTKTGDMAVENRIQNLAKAPDGGTVTDAIEPQ